MSPTRPRDSAAPEPVRDAASSGIDIAAVRSIQIGRYKVIGLIGAGGMGIVYAARDRELGRRVAIKVLRPEMSEERSAKTLIAEAKAMARLSHPNVCTVYEVGTTDDSVFLAMEYVDGQTLNGWLEKRPRTWQQVVDVMISVGKGVQAAHAAGIIHRDLKPDNIMIGRDGRVRVMDFGIATGALLVPKGGRAPTARPLASFSTLIGTPSYMAPELLHGARASELSDQFAFATTLYEALYGRRPYQGRTFGELMDAYDDNNLHEPGSRQRIPRWLRQVLLRGVATDPKRRYESIGAMVEDLTRIPRVRRLWQISGISLLLVIFGVLLTIFLFQRSLPAKNPCLGADERMASVWNSERRQTIEGALGKAGIQNAAEQWQRVDSLVDIYTDNWVSMRTEACEATRVRGEQSDDMLDRRMLCLEARRQELDELLAALTQADRGVAQRSVQAVLALEDIETCNARRDFLDAPPEPDDASVRAELVALRGRVATVKAAYDLGRYVQAGDEVADISRAAKATDYPPIIAAAKLLEGRVLLGLSELDRGEAALIDAWLAAERSSDDRTKLAALSELVMLLGFEARRHDDARRWLTYAEATMDRVGDAPRLEVSLLRAKNGLEMRVGHHDFASYEYTHSMSMRGYGPNHPMTALTLNDMASMALVLGRQEDALGFQTRALAIIGEVLGEQHPMAAEVINNLGNAYYKLGRLDEARSNYERSLAIFESFFGSKHSRVAIALSNLGNVYYDQEEFSDAIPRYKRVLTIEQELLGRDHPNSVPTMLNLARAYHYDFEDEAALAILARASVIVGEERSVEAAEISFVKALSVFANDRDGAVALAQTSLSIYKELGQEFLSDRKEVQEWLKAPN